MGVFREHVTTHARASTFVTLGAHLLVAMLGVSRCIGVVYTGDRFRDVAVPADQGGASVMQVFLLTLVATETVASVVERFYALWASD